MKSTVNGLDNQVFLYKPYIRFLFYSDPLSSSQTVDLVLSILLFIFIFLLFYFLFLEQLGLGLIGHTVTSVTT